MDRITSSFGACSTDRIHSCWASNIDTSINIDLDIDSSVAIR